MNSRAWYVTQYGFADYANAYNVSISYGSPGTRHRYAAYYIHTGGSLVYNAWSEEDSYGK